MSELPKDPVILLGVINTYLRDRDCCLDELCGQLLIKKEELCEKLHLIGFDYDAAANQFR